MIRQANQSAKQTMRPALTLFSVGRFLLEMAPMEEPINFPNQSTWPVAFSGTKRFLRAALSHHGIGHPNVSIRLLWKESDGPGTLYEAYLPPGVSQRQLVILCLETEVDRWCYHGKSRLLVVFAPDTDQEACAQRLLEGFKRAGHIVDWKISKAREERLSPLGYDIHLAEADQDEKDEAQIDCVAVLRTHSVEEGQKAAEVRKAFLDGARKLAELWAKKTGRPLTEASILKEQKWLLHVGAICVLEKPPEGQSFKHWCVFKNPPEEPDLIIEIYELKTREGYPYQAVYATL